MPFLASSTHSSISEGAGQQIKRPTGLGGRGLALNDFYEQGHFALGRPAFDLVFHQCAHCVAFKENT